MGDKIAIIARNGRHLKEAFLRIISEAHKRGLEVNQEKTKCIQHKKLRGTMRGSDRKQQV